MMNMNFKKILALLLVLTMVAALPITAFAEGNATNGTNTGEGSGSFDINASISGKDNPTEAAVKISVDITWEEMKFTYTEGSLGTWDATNHKYVGGTDGAWSTNKPAISVKNHSNSVIQAQFSFSSDLGVSGKFYTEDQDSTGTVYNEITGTPAVYLETAEAYSATKAPEGKLHFGVDSTSAGITQSGKLGTITVAIAQSNKICGGASLQKAIESYEGIGGTIKLDQDIDMRGTEYPVVAARGIGKLPSNTTSSGEPLVIDLDGHTIYGFLYLYTSYVVIKNGTVAFYSEDYDGLDDDVKSSSRSNGVITAIQSYMKLENIVIDVDTDGTDNEGNGIMGTTGLYNLMSQIDISGKFSISGGREMGTNTYVSIMSRNGIMNFSGEVDVYCLLVYIASQYGSVTLKSGEGNTYSFNAYNTTAFGALDLDGADMDADAVYDKNSTADAGIIKLY